MKYSYIDNSFFVLLSYNLIFLVAGVWRIFEHVDKLRLQLMSLFWCCLLVTCHLPSGAFSLPRGLSLGLEFYHLVVLCLSRRSSFIAIVEACTVIVSS